MSDIEQRLKRLEDKVFPMQYYCGCSVPCEPTKSRRQEKVEELAKSLSQITIQMVYGKGMVDNYVIAEAALEWFSQQVSDPKHLKNADYYYREALSDVRKNLGLDS